MERTLRLDLLGEAGIAPGHIRCRKEVVIAPRDLEGRGTGEALVPMGADPRGMAKLFPWGEEGLLLAGGSYLQVLYPATSFCSSTRYAECMDAGGHAHHA